MRQTIWDFWAPRYERLYAQYFSLTPTRRMVLDHLDAAVPQARRILDLGCGVGQLARELAARRPAAHIVAVDASAAMIERACRDYAGPQIEYRHGSCEAIADGERFDVIVSTHAFPYIPEKQQALHRLYQLLRPGGRLIIAQGNTQNVYDRFFYLLVKLTVSKSEYLSTQRLSQMLRDAHFTLGAVQPLPRAPFIPSIYLVEGIK